MSPQFARLASAVRQACLQILLLAAIALLAGAAHAQGVAEYLQRAGQHHADNNWKAAIADATAALKLDPNSARAYNLRGDARAQLREFEGALADLTEAIRLDPNMRVAYVNRGAVYEEAGRNALALADYDSVTARTRGLSAAAPAAAGRSARRNGVRSYHAVPAQSRNLPPLMRTAC